MATPENDRRDPHRVDDVDAALRRLLEPNPPAVERLVRSALAEGRPRTARWWPRLAVAAAALVALLVVLIPDPTVPPPEPVPAAATPVRISISNADGFVTVSSTAGSQWILVPGDDS